MIDKIITDHIILRQISKPISNKDAKRLRLRQRLKKANKTAWTKGCGLVAIQIGIPARFGWFIFEKKEFTLLNPLILSYVEPITHRGEGCLSIPQL